MELKEAEFDSYPFIAELKKWLTVKEDFTVSAFSIIDHVVKYCYEKLTMHLISQQTQFPNWGSVNFFRWVSVAGHLIMM